MLWPMLAISFGFLGVMVLGVLAVRVGIEVARLGRQVEDAADRIGGATVALEQASLRLARAGEDLR
ncbi:hypothetical protein [Streptomyces cyaneofuscatus]|uniref:hypothetical protein n=1 Tax=Streptomyces cyaneofuscatus TaxID=66883 RepID=UPI0037D59010